VPEGIWQRSLPSKHMVSTELMLL